MHIQRRMRAVGDRVADSPCGRKRQPHDAPCHVPSQRANAAPRGGSAMPRRSHPRPPGARVAAAAAAWALALAVLPGGFLAAAKDRSLPFSSSVILFGAKDMSYIWRQVRGFGCLVYTTCMAVSRSSSTEALAPCRRSGGIRRARPAAPTPSGWWPCSAMPAIYEKLTTLQTPPFCPLGR